MLAVIVIANATESFIPPADEGWAELLPVANPWGAAAVSVHLFYKLADASEPASHAFTVANAGSVLGQGRMYAWTGVDPLTPHDTTPQELANAADLTVEVPAITPVTPGAWIVRVAAAGHGTTAGGTLTVPNDHSNRGGFVNTSASGVKRPGVVFDKAWGGSGVEPQTVVNSSISGASSGVSIALKPGSADTTPPAAPTGLAVLLTPAA